jgi:GTP-binding protein
MENEFDTNVTLKLPVVVIVGRPNVGKSTLFNRIIKQRLSIVHSESGVTRDRIAANATWNEQTFLLVDTGGLGCYVDEKSAGFMDRQILEQLTIAIDNADKIVFVVDSMTGVTPLDIEVGMLLRKSSKPIIVAANKADNPTLVESAVEITQLGIETIIPVSCSHNFNISYLLDTIIRDLPRYHENDSTFNEVPALNVAIVGRPNVGKSSLINQILDEERVIVSDIPGTTRDAVDIPFHTEVAGAVHRFNLVDTAGIRHKNTIKSRVEFFSLERTHAAIKRASLTAIVFDAASPITLQDKKICRLVIDAQKTCVLLLNKWDLACKEYKQKDIYAYYREELAFLDYAPILTCCARSGYNLKSFIQILIELGAQLNLTLPTSIVNRVIQDLIARQPPTSTGKGFLKIYYSLCKTMDPPTFLLFVNNPAFCPKVYVEYLKKQLRKAFGLTGQPVVIELKKRRLDR